ncbi:hypothetical protein WH96_20140 [Kiloniella spongiae]|uniref:HAD-IIIC family phosphatase n=2 Tax=Kiloniella spongiae TaxID=1489064 RepID=A0A0H2M9Z9_9PROT|nr:hypothetical protein WH96_20140 [Kiloniella spongiae]
MEEILGDSKAAAIRTINDYIRTQSMPCIDIEYLAATVGIANWYDRKYYDVAKYPFSPKYLPLFCDYVVRMFAALYGKNKKCLVLDLDNTLWGGVVGDDGYEHIEIGNGTPKGEAFLRLQQTILDLKQRGVILAVCSKNNHQVALLPFKKRPEMLLTEDDISIFISNWHDKATNIKGIAETLSIGLDSIVFLDDNPAEREIVRQKLPTVSVIELPDDPSQYADILLMGGWFDICSFTNEDSNKTHQYKENEQRINASKEHVTIDSYLKSLSMTLQIDTISDKTFQRTVQLINKTNQFNMTAQRYSEAQISELMRDDRYTIIVASLHDKFGSNGIISVVICKHEGKTLIIENWVMSCRVLKRGVEYALINEITRLANTMNIENITGYFKATSRNDLVSTFYNDMGFIMSSAEITADRNIQEWVSIPAQIGSLKHFININSSIK